MYMYCDFEINIYTCKAEQKNNFDDVIVIATL